MAITPIQNVWFDDAVTLAMGEAFDRACKSFRNLGSAVPEIIAYLIIQAAKTGERDPARLYEQVLNAFSIEDMSMPVVSVGSDLPVPTYAAVPLAGGRLLIGSSKQIFFRERCHDNLHLAWPFHFRCRQGHGG